MFFGNDYSQCLPPPTSINGSGNPVIDLHAIQGREKAFVLGGGNPAMDLHPIQRWGYGKKDLVDTDFTITQLDSFKIEASCDN